MSFFPRPTYSRVRTFSKIFIVKKKNVFKLNQTILIANLLQEVIQDVIRNLVFIVATLFDRNKYELQTLNFVATGP